MCNFISFNAPPNQLSNYNLSKQILSFLCAFHVCWKVKSFFKCATFTLSNNGYRFWSHTSSIIMSWKITQNIMKSKIVFICHNLQRFSMIANLDCNTPKHFLHLFLHFFITLQSVTSFHFEVHVQFAQNKSKDNRYHSPRDSIKGNHCQSFWTSNHYNTFLTIND
jgi:hypothetical protein